MTHLQINNKEWSPLTHESMFVSTFIRKDRRDRYAKLLESKKGRAKLRLNLPHINDLNDAYLHAIKPSDQNIPFILSQLRHNGVSKTCHIIAESSRYDQTSMPLEGALQSLFGSGLGYILSCIPGKVLYYEGEGFNERYLLLNIY